MCTQSKSTIFTDILALFFKEKCLRNASIGLKIAFNLPHFIKNKPTGYISKSTEKETKICENRILLPIQAFLYVTKWKQGLKYKYFHQK